ncbi:hypothetical protein P3X46_006724 [Hevea brasiliensis]|uniref:RRM domain-containing protein n=1 Tax=Hevea brasiliensis TaxID=3981 RepID=A0ABQ9MR51_HEVBR|nr:organelle RRM domain-containing protein 2, mitochondrial [Hevea brasiliensis]KAJ9182767.1 hypothetical protein P3X46_006724 [Hevea brasiliensis]
MAMRARAALAAAPRSLLRLFSTTSTSSFVPPPTPADASAREQAEPNANLFVSGLSKRTTTEGLREAFSKFGEVVHARVVTDRVSGYSKGFGFVRYGSLEDAAKGIEGMDGKFLDGWVIFAEYARPRPSPTPPGNNVAPGYGSNRGPAYGNAASPAFQSTNPEYGNAAGPAYQTNMGPEYGNATGPAYQSNMRPAYGNTTGPTHVSNNTGPVYGNTTDPAYTNASGPAYNNTSTPTNGNASGPAYGNVDPTYGNGMGAPYGYQ